MLYDIRGPIMDAARQMEDEGQKIIKLNLGNLAVFGFDAPEEIQQDKPPIQPLYRKKPFTVKRKNRWRILLVP